MIHAKAKAGDGVGAMETLRAMQRAGFETDCHSYNTTIFALGEVEQLILRSSNKLNLMSAWSTKSSKNVECE